jgi:hypothetical protein
MKINKNTYKEFLSFKLNKWEVSMIEDRYYKRYNKEIK